MRGSPVSRSLCPRRPSRLPLAASALLLAVALLACDGSSPTEVIIEEEVEVETVIESFSGTIGQDEISCHSFVTTLDGDINLTLTDLQPLETLTVGLSFGRPDSEDAALCVTEAQDNSVRLLETLLSPDRAADEYCACVFDVGNIFPSETVTYVLDVEHP